MHYDKHALVVKSKRWISFPKDLNATDAWNIIAPVLARKIGVSDYTAIPNCFDMNTYRIGHIFVPTSAQVTCFRAVPILKVLGPICDYTMKAETNIKWLDKEFHCVRTSGEQMDFHIILEKNGRNYLKVKCENCYFLDKADDMPTPWNITINRTAHEDLRDTKWIGLITNVVTAKLFELCMVKGPWERLVHIGDDDAHTIFFKYEICEVNNMGAVIDSHVKKIRCKWQEIEGDKKPDGLPMSKLRNAS